MFTLSEIQRKEVQTRLRELGFYNGLIDGSFGPLTNEAIVSFKKSVGLAPRPYYGPLTHEALMQSPRLPSPTPWLDEARRMLNIHERRDNAKLRAWLVKPVNWIDPAKTAWCAAFICSCFRLWKPEIELPINPLGARQWASWGERCDPQVGAVMSFWRGKPSGWEGHVAFYVGEDRDAYHVLGGNQADMVSITRLSKTRLIDARWPAGHPQVNRKVALDSVGSMSSNEA